MLRNTTKIKTFSGPANFLCCSYQLCKCFYNVHNGMKKKILPTGDPLKAKMAKVIRNYICYNKSPANISTKKIRKQNDLEKNSYAFTSCKLKVIYFPHVNIPIV